MMTKNVTPAASHATVYCFVFAPPQSVSSCPLSYLLLVSSSESSLMCFVALLFSCFTSICTLLHFCCSSSAFSFLCFLLLLLLLFHFFHLHFYFSLLLFISSFVSSYYYFLLRFALFFFLPSLLFISFLFFFFITSYIFLVRTFLYVLISQLQNDVSIDLLYQQYTVVPTVYHRFLPDAHQHKFSLEFSFFFVSIPLYLFHIQKWSYNHTLHVVRQWQEPSVHIGPCIANSICFKVSCTNTCIVIVWTLSYTMYNET